MKIILWLRPLGCISVTLDIDFYLIGGYLKIVFFRTGNP